jgi:hypothetical protein
VNEDTIYELAEKEDTVAESIIREWMEHKGIENARQAWTVIPRALITGEYEYSLKKGCNRVKAVEYIEKILVRNYLKLKVNTILCHHESIRPFCAYENLLPEEMTEEDFNILFEDFEWFACDENGDWRISDTLITKMGNFIYELIEEPIPEKKFFWIDCILGLAHRRSNFASWLVEGGSNTLDSIFNYSFSRESFAQISR